jgi:NitT/TauT family transport system substrate-binding protein
METSVWEEQISLYAQLGQFRASQPKVEDVMTLDLLKATLSSRLTV